MRKMILFEKYTTKQTYKLGEYSLPRATIDVTIRYMHNSYTDARGLVVTKRATKAVIIRENKSFRDLHDYSYREGKLKEVRKIIPEHLLKKSIKNFYNL